jgi:hypothetical protein
MRLFLAAFLIGLCGSNLVGEEPTPQAYTLSSGRTLPHELSRRIFDVERETIAQFAKSSPIVETYIQSLDPEVTPAAVIDDAYFLTRISLDADRERAKLHQQFAFGGTLRDRQIRVNTRDSWSLKPEGYVDMSFVDLTDFDDDTYILTYTQDTRLNHVDCLLIAVTPRYPESSGQFVGNIWAEKGGLHIVRIEGSFTPRRLGRFVNYLNLSGMSTLGIYFHFDSRRQEVSPGIWMPSFTYFEDKRLWNQTKLNTSYCFRGYVWMWGYGRDEAEAQQRLASDDPVTVLQAAGLLASPGPVEGRINQLVQEIQISGGVSRPEIQGRILLTTPVEIFSSGDTIFLSRGLLNVVPNESVLAVFLAREIAAIRLGKLQKTRSKIGAVFNSHGISDFSGLGLGGSGGDRAITDQAAALLKGTPYAGAIGQADRFEASLALYAAQVPQLVRARFGRGFAGLRPKKATDQALRLEAKPDGLTLRSDYGVDSSQDSIILLGGSDRATETASDRRAPGGNQDSPRH